jgi:hypothetical protein
LRALIGLPRTFFGCVFRHLFPTNSFRHLSISDYFQSLAIPFNDALPRRDVILQSRSIEGLISLLWGRPPKAKTFAIGGGLNRSRRGVKKAGREWQGIGCDGTKAASSAAALYRRDEAAEPFQAPSKAWIASVWRGIVSGGVFCESRD